MSLRWWMAFPLALVTATTPARATPAIDQEQPVIDSTVGGLGIGGGSEQQPLPFQTLVESQCAPPVIGQPSASPARLWPPDRRMVDVTVGYTVGGSCSASCTLNIASDEAPEGIGDGSTTRDWIVLDPNLVRLRAERAGFSDGRIYTVAIVCTNASGQTTSQSIAVSVPHDQGSLP